MDSGSIGKYIKHDKYCIGCTHAKQDDNDIPHNIAIQLELLGVWNTDSPTVFV
jgi:hypothetical protein